MSISILLDIEITDNGELFAIKKKDGHINENDIRAIMPLLSKGGRWYFHNEISDSGYSVLSEEIIKGSFLPRSLLLCLLDVSAENLNKLILCAGKLRRVLLGDSSDTVGCPEALDAKCNELKDHGVHVAWSTGKNPKHYEAFRPEAQ